MDLTCGKLAAFENGNAKTMKERGILGMRIINDDSMILERRGGYKKKNGYYVRGNSGLVIVCHAFK